MTMHAFLVPTACESAQFNSQKDALFLDEIAARGPYCRPFLNFEQFKEKNDSKRMCQVRNHTGPETPADRQGERLRPEPTKPTDR
jgi:hypothetical protein